MGYTANGIQKFTFNRPLRRRGMMLMKPTFKAIPLAAAAALVLGAASSAAVAQPGSGGCNQEAKTGTDQSTAAASAWAPTSPVITAQQDKAKDKRLKEVKSPKADKPPKA
jgi:opacity protein-like surface antigen